MQMLMTNVRLLMDISYVLRKSSLFWNLLLIACAVITHLAAIEISHVNLKLS